jgi:hypothetical protein
MAQPENIAIVKCGGESHRIEVSWWGDVTLLDHNDAMVKAFAAFGAEPPECLRLVQEAQKAIDYAKRHIDDWTKTTPSTLEDMAYAGEWSSERAVEQLDYDAERVAARSSQLAQQASYLERALSKLLATMNEEDLDAFNFLRGHEEGDDRYWEMFHTPVYDPIVLTDEEAAFVATLPPKSVAAADFHDAAQAMSERATMLKALAHDMYRLEDTAMEARRAVRNAIVALLEERFVDAEKLADKAAYMAERYNVPVWNQFSRHVDAISREQRAS